MVMPLVILVMLGLLFVAERVRPAWVQRAEENFLALLLATMTLVSFTQVIARYGFNTGWGGALEFTRILFAWMILFGMSYGIKNSSHLGVDALIHLFPKSVFKTAALFGAVCGILYGVVLLSADWLQFFGANTKGGALVYWTKFYNAGIGLDDLRYPVWFQELFGQQERVQRWVAYLMLPLGLALFAYRCVQATVQIWRGERGMIVASHEAEDLVAENKIVMKD